MGGCNAHPRFNRIYKAVLNQDLIVAHDDELFWMLSRAGIPHLELDPRPVVKTTKRLLEEWQRRGPGVAFVPLRPQLW